MSTEIFPAISPARSRRPGSPHRRLIRGTQEQRPMRSAELERKMAQAADLSPRQMARVRRPPLP
jgi:hypothetical protein